MMDIFELYAWAQFPIMFIALCFAVKYLGSRFDETNARLLYIATLAKLEHTSQPASEASTNDEIGSMVAEYAQSVPGFQEMDTLSVKALPDAEATVAALTVFLSRNPTQARLLKTAVMGTRAERLEEDFHIKMRGRVAVQEALGRKSVEETLKRYDEGIADLQNRMLEIEMTNGVEDTDWVTDELAELC